MLPTVAILLPPEEARAPHVRAMEDACTSAAPRDTFCRVIESGAGVGEVLAVATVVWLDRDRRIALVQVRLGSESARERRVEFAASDPERERWRAVGFAVATLVGERIEEGSLPPGPALLPSALPPASASAPPPPPPASASAAPPPAASSSAPPAGSAPPPVSSEAPPPPPPSAGPAARPLMAGVTVGGITGLDSAVLGAVEAHGRVGMSAGLELSLAAGTTLLGGGDPEQVKEGFTWVAGGVRAGLWAGRLFRPFFRAELMVEGVSLEAKRGVFRDTLTRWRPGGRVGLDLDLVLTSWLDLEARVELGARPGSLTVVVASKEAGVLPVLRPSLGLGVVSRF